MKARLPSLFGRARRIERKIDEFFDKIAVATLLFSNAIDIYLSSGRCAPYLQKMDEIEALESEGDRLRRAIETELYTQTLIPDLRGDVLSLLEDMDDLINLYEASIFKFDIEQPEFPLELHDDLRRLVAIVCQCVEQVLAAGRAFFRDIQSVRDYIAKVQWLESEADKMSTRLLRAIFDSDLPLANKNHLRYFVERIDHMANAAEDISDSLSIYAIKRRI